MDVDENTSQQQGNDIEQSFLQQFSCLGTTDHDELVGKFQKLLGNQLNYATARFFLDMNNWNLQAAVGCYFDFYSGQKLPSMQIVADVTVGEGEGVTPNTLFQQSWKVQNNGEERWPDGCYIKLTSVPDGKQIPIPALDPGETTIITIQLLSPTELGSFQTKWRFCTPNGSNFGDTIWAIVQVCPTGTLAITQQLSDLHTTPGGGISTAAATSAQQSTSLQNFNQLSSVPIPLPPPPSQNLYHQPQNSADDNDMC